VTDVERGDVTIDLSVPRRVTHVLDRAGITSLPDLLDFSERSLRALPGVGDGTVTAVRAALAERGLALAPDRWAAYICARDGTRAADVGLAGFFLCGRCRAEYSAEALNGAAPEWTSGEAVGGNCGHCNEVRGDVRFTQWLLCGVCERVLRSLGRGLASVRYVVKTWAAENIEQLTGLRLVETDPPRLRPRGRSTDSGRRAMPDFTLFDKGGVAVAGFELKSGKKAARGGGVGQPMSRFQLDTSDCDAVLAVVRRERFPVYLLHAQVIGRANPPTEIYHGVGLWWTDLWTMGENFLSVNVRPRETRNAAYYRNSMFRPIRELPGFIGSGGIVEHLSRLRRDGTPSLYELRAAG
jgi:hypothetical protein